MGSTDLKRESLNWKSWTLSQRQICDLELILNGGFKPLNSFMLYKDFERVCQESRLSDGTVWPIPVTLDITKEFADRLKHGEKIALRDTQGVMIAALTIEDIWQSDKAEEAELVYGAVNYEHPGVKFLLNHVNPIYVGGSVEVSEMPRHFDFTGIRHCPGDLSAEFQKRSWSRVIAFQTRNPIHRAHYEIIKRAADASKAKILIHPAVGMTKPGDIDYFTRVKCYQAVLPRFDVDKTMLSLLPLAMRMAGPREAVWHAIIRKNYGCTHFIVGREHASPGKDSKGRDFYKKEAYSEYLSKFKNEIGIEIVDADELVFIEEDRMYQPVSAIQNGKAVKSISGTELRALLDSGEQIPDWYTFAEVDQVLRKSLKPKKDRGLTIFLTGLPSAGKSTIAEILLVKLLENGTRPVTLLDGDEVRQLLSSELGFSKEHRDLNIRRIGFVASEISKNGGIAICAPIAPYDDIRREVRERVERNGNFILVYIDTPLEICEKRDRKGLYAKAKAGLVKGFTGIDDPYEVPHDADITIDTTKESAEEASQRIFKFVSNLGHYSDIKKACSGKCGKAPCSKHPSNLISIHK